MRFRPDASASASPSAVWAASNTEAPSEPSPKCHAAMRAPAHHLEVGQLKGSLRNRQCQPANLPRAEIQRWRFPSALSDALNPHPILAGVRRAQLEATTGGGGGSGALVASLVEEEEKCLKHGRAVRLGYDAAA